MNCSEEETMKKISYKNKNIIVFGVAIALALIISSLVVRTYNNRDREKKSDEGIEYILQLEENPSNLSIKGKVPEYVIIDRMHRMANSKIIAEDGEVWGILEPEWKKINALKICIESESYKNNKKLLDILERWSKNDFSNAVEEHNYLWRLLGGTIGKANKLK